MTDDTSNVLSVLEIMTDDKSNVLSVLGIVPDDKSNVLSVLKIVTNSLAGFLRACHRVVFTFCVRAHARAQLVWC